MMVTYYSLIPIANISPYICCYTSTSAPESIGRIPSEDME